MNKKSFEEILNEQGRLVYTNVGDSMFPLIKPRDLLVIEKPQFPLKKYDIPLYKRNSGGKYVLHRIVKIENGEYLICGDNRYGYERGITDKNIIGVLASIIRDGKTINLNTKKYRLYCQTLGARRLILHIRNKLNV